QGAVHDGSGLGAGDVVVRPERAVGVALDKADLHRGRDELRVPASAAHVGEGVLIDIVRVLEEADGYLGKLRAGDRRVRAEGAVGVAVYDAHVAQRGYGVVEPAVGG